MIQTCIGDPDMEKGTPRASIREAREKLAASDLLSGQSSRRFDEIARRFESFCQKGFDVEGLADVTPAQVEAFVKAKADAKVPAAATMHMRRTALRLLFRIARSEFGVDGDPTLDLVLPPKSGLSTRPLTDDEIALGRSYSLHNLRATRGPAAWALGEATAITSELPYITADDLDLDQGRVWLHGSNKRIERWGALTDWGSNAARAASQSSSRQHHPPDLQRQRSRRECKCLLLHGTQGHACSCRAR